MGVRRAVAIVVLALLAAALGLAASVALYGPGPLARSELGRRLLGVVTASPPAGIEVVAPGGLVAPFRLAGLDGPDRQLPIAGRATLVNYWASWCGPCREELPLLADFAAHQGPNGVAVVTVALDDPAQALEFHRQHAAGLPSLVESPGTGDSSVRLGNGLGVLPYTVLIGADGRLLKRQFGPFHDRRELEAWARGR